MTDSNITLSAPEAEAPSMVGPGQEGLLEEFLAEQEQEQPAEQGSDLLLGKFRSADELAKAYQELERKLGQPRDGDPDDAPISPEPPQAYTREQSVNDYGEFLSDVFEAAEVNPYEIAQKWEQGEDLTSYVDALEAAGIPRPVVEQYLAKPGQQAPAVEFTEADTSELKSLVGGDEGFQQLSEWALANLDAEELVDYNAVVNSGNKTAIRAVLRSMQARAKAGNNSKPAEPKLIGGKAPGEGTRFESKQQVLDAMTKRNAKGQKLYDVDDAYRSKVRDMLARSDVF